MNLNLIVAWTAVLTGLVSGTVIGLFFHRDEWLGGYGSWRRRMVRLGHISFLGTGLLNLGFAVTLAALGERQAWRVPSLLFVVGAISMPAVCFLSAWRKPFRQLFFIPVLSLIGGAAGALAQVLLAARRS